MSTRAGSDGVDAHKRAISPSLEPEDERRIFSEYFAKHPELAADPMIRAFVRAPIETTPMAPGELEALERFRQRKRGAAAE